MAQKRPWPRMLWIVRHGESIGNLAAAHATALGLPAIELSGREIDVPLSPLGERQALAVGQWFAAAPAEERPTAILSSPYARARQTAERVRDGAGLGAAVLVDERIRERELGVLNRLTRVGVAERFPEQLALQEQFGKFYYRPPGGESWCDVSLRLRSFLDTLARDYAGEHVLIACHSALVFLFRYLLEGMEADRVVALSRSEEIANCSLTAYRADRAGRPVLELFNHVAPLEEASEPITEKPNAGEAAGQHA